MTQCKDIPDELIFELYDMMPHTFPTFEAPNLEAMHGAAACIKRGETSFKPVGQVLAEWYPTKVVQRKLERLWWRGKIHVKNYTTPDRFDFGMLKPQ